MSEIRQREIVVELERVETVRRRATTSYRYCTDCRALADFLTVTETAGLFGIKPGIINEFVHRHAIHRMTSDDGRDLICLASLLAHADRDSTLRRAPARLPGS